MSADIDADSPVSSAGPIQGLRVTRSSAEETAGLRRSVLRPHQTIEQMAVDGDQNPETAYLAVRAPSGHGGLVGCLRLEPVRCPWPEALDGPARAWQLRAMAADPAVRGAGIGRLLVEAAVAHVTQRGGDLIWCNARISAEGFYARLGFRTVTDRYVVPEVTEEHVGMALRIPS